jgi:hypothetical protein
MLGVGGREINILGLEGSQAVPACPSGRDNAYDQRNYYKFNFYGVREAALERNLIRN